MSHRTSFKLAALWTGVAVATLSLGFAYQDGVAASAEESKPIKAGAMIPETTLTSLEGKTTTLKEALGGKPTVLIFYRGGWCPFCNRHLADLAKVEADIHKRGYQIVAISPDTPEELKKTLDKDQLTYKLFSDSSADAMKKFGVAFRVDDGTFTKYRDQYKIDLERSSGQTHHILPVPSIFLVDKAGKITYVHFNPDYKVRLKGSEILQAIDEGEARQGF